MPALVLLSRRAVADLAGLGERRGQVEKLLRALEQAPWPENLDVKALRGRAPWSRARTGPYRVIFRPLTAEESATRGAPRGRAYLVARVVHRRELEQAIAKLSP